MSTLVSHEMLRRNCEAEGIDYSRVCVCAPRWAESRPRSAHAKSALVRCDTIIRDDGSAVLLDAAMSGDGLIVAKEHVQRGAIPAAEWPEYVAKLTLFPA